MSHVTFSYSETVILPLFFSCLQEVLEAKCEPEDEVPQQLSILSGTSLRRSISQLMDGKSLEDDVWDPNISGHDSGMVSSTKPSPSTSMSTLIVLLLRSSWTMRNSSTPSRVLAR